MTTSDGYPQIVLSGTDPNLPKQFTNSYAKYSQFKPMASGGKAELFSCWDNSLGRLVAVKTLRPEFAKDERERRRFLREARVTAQLQHPNTVPVYEVGIANDGSLYFTMKRLLGEDLYAVIKRLQQRDPGTKRAFPIPRLVEILVQTCQALAYAHSHGVIHRDVKPENIWLGRFGEVRILDWGVAKVWGQLDEPIIDDRNTTPAAEPNEQAENEALLSLSSDGQHSRLATLTKSGNRPGTPLYMSPEQVGGHRYVDERSDVFSVGVVLYELLTLQLPFHGGSIESTFEKILNDAPLPLREQAPARGIPDSFQPVVVKALAKEPGKRHQSMEHFLKELSEALDEAKR